jgi:hypothetical protein
MMRPLLAMCLVVAAACGGPKGGTGTSSPKAAGNAVALAIVMSGWEIWVGNDRVLEESDPARYLGALDYVKAAVDGAELGKLPAGSEGTLILYADKASVKLPLGPVASLNGQALGGQKEYAGTTGQELVAGIELGLAELKKSSAKHKVLVVLGDGSDTNPATAKDRLAALHKQAVADGIELHAVVYKTQLSEPAMPIASFAQGAVTASNVDDVKAKLGAILGGLRK